MPVITIQVPDETLAALRKDPEEFAREMRIAAAVEWYAEGVFGLSRQGCKSLRV